MNDPKPISRARRFWLYVLDRARESSTWRGVVVIAAAFGAKLEPDKWEAIVLVGLAASGLIGAALPDRKEK